MEIAAGRECLVAPFSEDFYEGKHLAKAVVAIGRAGKMNMAAPYLMI
jgi:hypothetical protein